MTPPESTPDMLVESGTRRYGRFPDRVRIANPSDAYQGLARLWHRFRLKEWVGFTLIHPQLSAAMIMQDAQYLSSSELYVRDRTSGTMVEKSLSLFGRGITLPNELLDNGRARVSRPGYFLEYRFDAADQPHGTIRARIYCLADDDGPAIRGELTFYPDDAPPLSLSGRLTDSIDLYTFKRPFAAEGTITVGAQRYEFRRNRDFAIIDEHRSFFPYATDWTWGTFATRLPVAGADSDTRGATVGSNFVDRVELTDDDDESANWIPGAIEPLAAITIDRDVHDPMQPARAYDRDGRLDVTFTPAGHKDVRVTAGIVAIDYTQIGGTYSGTVTSRAGQVFSVDTTPGVLERMKTRF